MKVGGVQRALNKRGQLKTHSLLSLSDKRLLPQKYEGMKHQY